MLGGAGRGRFDCESTKTAAACGIPLHWDFCCFPSSNFTGSVAKDHGYFDGSSSFGNWEVRALQGVSPTVANCTPTKLCDLIFACW
jgi:hypothetical protein